MRCRICNAEQLDVAVDLGLQPWANHFLRPEDAGKEPFYPLRVVHCANCAAAQLDYTVPKETMFAHHTYVSGTTHTLRRHFLDTAKGINARFFADTPGKTILDIGSNDGTQLLQYRALGYETLGVESCREVAEQAIAQGMPTEIAFFNADWARKTGRQFHLINASGVFFHLEELHSATEGVRMCLRPDGVFVVQFLYMKSILENLAFDQIYHEHLLYYTVATIGELLARHGLEPFDAYLSPIHGGSIVLMASHPGAYPRTDRLDALLAEEQAKHTNDLATYHRFAEQVRAAREHNRAWIDDAVGRGRTIYGMGAPVKGNTLLNYFGFGPDRIRFLVEKNPLRKGLVSPGMHIPIILEDEISTPPDIYYVLAWNFKKEILANNQSLLERGTEFYFPVNPKEDT